MHWKDRAAKLGPGYVGESGVEDRSIHEDIIVSKRKPRNPCLPEKANGAVQKTKLAEQKRRLKGFGTLAAC